MGLWFHISESVGIVAFCSFLIPLHVATQWITAATAISPHDFPKNPVLGLRRSRVRRPAVIVRLPNLLPPHAAVKRQKEKTKGRNHPIRPRQGPLLPPSPPTRTRTVLPPPACPLPGAGAPNGVSSGVGGSAAPRTLHGEGELLPKFSASRPSHWLLPTHRWGVL